MFMLLINMHVFYMYVYVVNQHACILHIWLALMNMHVFYTYGYVVNQHACFYTYDYD